MTPSVGAASGTELVVLALFTGGATVALTPPVLVGLRRWGVLDHPSERSSHDRPIVRGGGIALVVAAVAAYFAAAQHTVGVRGPGVPVAALGFGLIGLADDVKGISPVSRLFTQLLVALAGGVWLLSGLEGPALWRVAFAIGALFWLVAYVNAFNFMDGINGISSVQSLLAGLTWAWIGYDTSVVALAWGGAILSGVSMGFLPFNFPVARLFIGDVGSYFLGGWQAALVVVGLRAGVPIEAILAPVSLYVADTGFTLVTRLIDGEPWHQPHRRHVYQRLVRQGMSHTTTTLTVGLFCAFYSALGIAASGELRTRILADLGLATGLAIYLVFPRLVSRARRIRNSN